jgi:hypothetical protein
MYRPLGGGRRVGLDEVARLPDLKRAFEAARVLVSHAGLSIAVNVSGPTTFQGMLTKTYHFSLCEVLFD